MLQLLQWPGAVSREARLGCGACMCVCVCDCVCMCVVVVVFCNKYKAGEERKGRVLEVLRFLMVFPDYIEKRLINFGLEGPSVVRLLY